VWDDWDDWDDWDRWEGSPGVFADSVYRGTGAKKQEISLVQQVGTARAFEQQHERRAELSRELELR